MAYRDPEVRVGLLEGVLPVEDGAGEVEARFVAGRMLGSRAEREAPEVQAEALRVLEVVDLQYTLFKNTQ